MTAGSGRHEARERALGLLYEAEMKDEPVTRVIQALPLPPDPYARELALGVDDHRDELDALLGRYSRNWTVARMPVVDRVVLRLACYELVHQSGTPRNVVLDEAVELAKAYGTDDSPRFVNGVLARIADEVRGPA